MPRTCEDCGAWAATFLDAEWGVCLPCLYQRRLTREALRRDAEQQAANWQKTQRLKGETHAIVV